MTDLVQEPEDATLLESSEREGLLQTWLTHRRVLNEAEQENIVEGAAGAAFAGAHSSSESSARTLCDRWTGGCSATSGVGRHLRMTERNIGARAYRIGMELASLFNDVAYWIEHQTIPADEIAIRFNYRLFAFHLFPNGNGRHARLAAGLLIERIDVERFSWGRRPRYSAPAGIRSH